MWGRYNLTRCIPIVGAHLVWFFPLQKKTSPQLRGVSAYSETSSDVSVTKIGGRKITNGQRWRFELGVRWAASCNLIYTYKYSGILLILEFQGKSLPKGSYLNLPIFPIYHLVFARIIQKRKRFCLVGFFWSMGMSTTIFHLIIMGHK